MLVSRIMGRARRGCLDTIGAVAAELAIVTPFLVLLILGVIDFGAYMNGSQAIAAATRIGAEYARDGATCRSGVQVLPTPSISTACTNGIENAMQDALNFSPALTFPNPPALTCQCDDGGAIDCGNNSCATAGRPAPNRVLITVSASQTIDPILGWAGFPTTLSGLTQIRLQ
jgi:Flp pilus assembly protein TadG